MFIRSIVYLGISFCFLFIISWQLSLAVLASIFPVMCYTFIYAKKMRSLQKTIQDSKAKISHIAEESFGNIRTVKAFANEKDESLRYWKSNNQVYH